MRKISILNTFSSHQWAHFSVSSCIPRVSPQLGLGSSLASHDGATRLQVWLTTVIIAEYLLQCRCSSPGITGFYWMEYSGAQENGALDSENFSRWANGHNQSLKFYAGEFVEAISLGHIENVCWPFSIGENRYPLTMVWALGLAAAAMSQRTNKKLSWQWTAANLPGSVKVMNLLSEFSSSHSSLWYIRPNHFIDGFMTVSSLMSLIISELCLWSWKSVLVANHEPPNYFFPN